MIHPKPDHQLCEDDKLIAVLRDGEDAAEHQEVVEHIEQCSRCQQRFDELAAGPQDWTKARQALLNDDPCSENRVGSDKWDYSLRNEGPVAWTESMASQLLSPASHPELLGRLGRYDVERLIGSGGMGIVFKAHDSELNRPVAIKILAPYLSSSGPARKRFAREARAAAAVVHEHVVPIYNVETEREVPFLVMHYIAGESLQGRIDREGALELCEILRIGMQVASGLSAAHQQGLVHRDIKPSNILMEQGVERALITDFGLARAADDASLTRTGFHPGTPQYMSPEQAAGEQVDARSDLFSLGSLLYTMCTGRPPFRAETSLGVLRRITDIEPRPIREINPSIPEWLCSIISKLMAKQANDRSTSAQEVAELLEDCLAHVQQPTSSPLPASLVPHAATVRRSDSNVTRTGVMTMLGTLGISLLGMFVWQATDPPDISGQWTSDEWGTVVLKAKEPGQYEGTFNGSEKVGPANDGENNISNKVPEGASETSTPRSAVEAIPPGKLHLKWSAIERRFNGNWGTGDDTKGKISLRLVDNEIRGACTSTNDSRKESTSPQLTDLLWKRSGGTSTSIIAAAEKEYQSTMSERPGTFLDRLQGTWRTSGEPMCVWEVFATGINETVFDAKGNVRTEEWIIRDEGNLNDLVNPARVELMAKDPKTGGFSGFTVQKCLLAVDGDSLVCCNSLAGDYPNEIAKGPRQFVRDFRRDKDKPLELLGDWIVDDWERGSGDESVLKSDDIDFPKYALRFHSDRFWLRALNGKDVESPDQGMMGYGDVRQFQWSIPGESKPGEFLLTVQSDNRTQLLYGRYQSIRTRPQAKPDRLRLTISRKPLTGDLPSASDWHFECHRAKSEIDPSGSTVFDDTTKSLDTRKSTAAEQELKQLELAEEDLRAAYGNAIDNAKSDEDRERAGNQFDQRNVYTPKYLAFEEKYRGTPAGLKALIKVVGFARSTLDPNSPAPVGRVEAVDRLIDHYTEFDGIEQAFDDLGGGLPVPRERELLKAVVEKNPSRYVRAEAMIAQFKLNRKLLLRHESLPLPPPPEWYPESWRSIYLAFQRVVESAKPDELRNEQQVIIEQLRSHEGLAVSVYGRADAAAAHLSNINRIVYGKRSPEIAAITSTGKSFRLSGMRGKTVVLVFAHDEGADNDLMYDPLRKLATDFKSKNVEVVMILTGDDRNHKSAAALKRDFPWTVIQQPSLGRLLLDWNVQGFPEVHLIDAKGILRSSPFIPQYNDESGYDTTEVAAELDKMLASKQSHNNDGSKGPIVTGDVKPGLSEPLGSNEPQLLPVAEAVKDSAVTLPPTEFDTLEDLLKPAKELFDNEMKQIDERLATVVEGSAEHSLLTTKKKQLQQRWDLSVAQVKGIFAAAKAGKPVQLDRIEIPNHSSRPGKAPMPVPLSGHDEDIANVLAGTWQLKRYEQDAEEASFEGSVKFSKSMMIVHLKQGDKQEELQQMYRIGSEKIDLWDMDDGLDIRTSLPHLGSYSIENDTLRICYHESPMEDDVPQTRPPVQPGNGFIYLELQRNVVAKKANVAKGKTNYADLQGDWIVDSFYVDKDANSRELQKLGSTALLLRTIRVEANELHFRNPPVAGMSRISGAISIKPAEGDDSRLFQVVDSRVPGEVIRFGMYEVVGGKLTILLTRDAPPKLLAPTEGEFYFECHRAVSEEDKELLNVINKNPDQINVIDLILKDTEKSVSAKEDTIATENVSGSEKPSATRAPDANGIYWSSRDLDHWVSGMKVLQWPNAVTRKLIVEFVARNDSPETREVDVHLYCGNKTSLLLGEGNNASVNIKETRREKQTAVPNGIVTFKEGRAEISFEGLETGDYTLRFQRVMDLQLADEGLPHGVSGHGVPFDVSLPVRFDSSQDSLPIYWGQPVAGLRIGAMFLDSRKDHMRSFKPRDQAASQLFVQNVGSKEVECGFNPPYHSGGWGVEIADKVGQRISGVWKDEHRSVGVLIPPSPMWARLAPSEIQPISGEFTKFRVRDDDYGGTTHYEHAKFTIVVEKPKELRTLPPYDYVLPTGEYSAQFSATLRKAESSAATFVLESGPCPFRVGVDGTTSTQNEGDVQWGPAGQNGLQAGVRFNPSQTSYLVGQPIKLEFFFRTVDGRRLEGSLPNVFDFDGVEARDTTGETLPALHTPSEVVGGWMSVHFSDKPMSRTYEKLTIVAETDGKLKNAESLASAISSDSSVVRAHPGTDCRVRFTVPNFANGADGTLQTGEVAFRVNEALTNPAPPAPLRNAANSGDMADDDAIAASGLTGKWSLQSMQWNGIKVPEEQCRQTTMTIEGHQLTFDKYWNISFTNIDPVTRVAEGGFTADTALEGTIHLFHGWIYSFCRSDVDVGNANLHSSTLGTRINSR